MSIPIDINKAEVYHLEILNEVVVPPASGDQYRQVYIKEQNPWSSKGLDLSIRANIPTGTSKGPRFYVSCIGRYSNTTYSPSSIGFYSWVESDAGDRHLYTTFSVLSDGNYGPILFSSSFVNAEVYVRNGKIGYIHELSGSEVKTEENLADFSSSQITKNFAVRICQLSNAQWTFKGLHAYTDTNPNLDIYSAKMNERYGVAEFIAGKFNKFYPFITQ